MPGFESKGLEQKDSLAFFSLLTMLGGGFIEKFSLFSLGVGPYITASVIVQLLSTDLVPVLSQWQKAGEKGRKKLELLTRILTIPFAILQGLATIFMLKSAGNLEMKWNNPTLDNNSKYFYYLMVPILLVAGVLVALWIADQITAKGVGNGVSLLIASGILAQLPTDLKSTWKTTGEDFLWMLFFIFLFFLVVLLVVFFNDSERRIPIQHTGGGLITSRSRLNFLPLKVNSAGVIPVIFSSALITAPLSISEIVKNAKGENGFTNFVNQYLTLNTLSGILIFASLTIFFTFLYAQIQINPQRLASNLQKSGTYLLGIKPGKPTETYIFRLLNRLSFFGALFLAFVTVLPSLINLYGFSTLFGQTTKVLTIGGTGIIIIVGVALDTVKQIRARIIQHRFLNKDVKERTEQQIW